MLTLLWYALQHGYLQAFFPPLSSKLNIFVSVCLKLELLKSLLPDIRWAFPICFLHLFSLNHFFLSRIFIVASISVPCFPEEGFFLKLALHSLFYILSSSLNFFFSFAFCRKFPNVSTNLISIHCSNLMFLRMNCAPHSLQWDLILYIILSFLHCLDSYVIYVVFSYDFFKEFELCLSWILRMLYFPLMFHGQYIVLYLFCLPSHN